MSLNIKNSIMSGLTCLVNAEVRNAILYCGKEYNFNAEEALKMYLLLGEEKGKCKSKKINKKLSYPIPYNGKEMEGCCKGLKQNNGLYTQCEYKPLGSSELCGVCTKNGCKYGRIEQRMESELYEYADPSGKKVTGYLKVLRKLKLDVLEVKESLKADGITIIEEHFEYEEEESKVEKKGRPKKAKKTMEKKEEIVVDDIFVEAVAVAVTVRERSHTIPTEETLTREQDGMIKEDVKKAPRKVESKKGKVEKEKKEKVVKEKVVKEKVVKVSKAKEEEEETDVVKKVEIDGQKYLKSKKTGVIYNMEQDVVGIWNEKSGKIDFNEEDEESEEEYEEEEIISCSGGGGGDGVEA